MALNLGVTTVRAVVTFSGNARLGSVVSAVQRILFAKASFGDSGSASAAEVTVQEGDRDGAPMVDILAQSHFTHVVWTTRRTIGTRGKSRVS